MSRPFLIVDDDIDHAVIIRTVLSSVAPEASVEISTDSRVAPAALQAAPEGAVVFIDRMLAGTESFPLIEQATAARDDLYVVMLSAVLSAEDREQALAVGARDAFEKPASIQEWRTMLGDLISRVGE